MAKLAININQQFVKDNRFESEETLIVPQERVYRVSASIADIIQCDEI